MLEYFSELTIGNSKNMTQNITDVLFFIFFLLCDLKAILYVCVCIYMHTHTHTILLLNIYMPIMYRNVMYLSTSLIKKIFFLIKYQKP